MIRKIARKMKRGVHKIIQRISGALFSLPIIPVQSRKIVFDNFNGKGYGCNPKYIAEELIREKVECDMVWLVNDFSYELPSCIRKVKYGSVKAAYELATAGIWIDNVRNAKGVKKKKQQFYLQTWHATLGLKKVEADVEMYLDKRYVKAAKEDGKITDLMIVNNEYMENLIRKSFWYHGEILKVGLPRNDVLLNPSQKLKEKIYQYFQIEENKKIVIYAPTFRNHLQFGVYQFNYKKVCEQLKQKFEGEFIMLVRLHPNIAKYDTIVKYDDIVLNATQYSDIQELLAIADVAITDYSSIMFDFSIAGKPVFLFAKDLEEYQAKERNLDFDLKTLPFSLSNREEELYEQIELFSESEYRKKCQKFYQEIGLKQKENSAYEIVKKLEDKMKKICK